MPNQSPPLVRTADMTKTPNNYLASVKLASSENLDAI